MFNLLRMDLYRMIRSKALYFCLAFLLVTIFLCYGIVFLTGTPEGRELAPKIGMGALTEGEPEEADILEGMTVIEMIRQSFMDGGSYSLVLGIVTALFVCMDFQSGFVKNIMTLHRKRWKYIGSKLMTIGIVNFFCLIICFGFGLVMNLLFHRMVPLGKGMDLVFYLTWAWFVMNAFAALIILVCILTRSIAAGIAASILLGSGLVLYPVYGLTNLFGLGGWFHYTIYYNISTGPSGYRTITDLRALVIGIIFLVLYGFLSMTALSKQDI